MNCFVENIDLQKLDQALKKIGQAGFPVKIVFNRKSQQTFEFVSAKNGELENSIFDLESFKQGDGQTSEQLLKDGKISEEQYKQMKIEEEKAKQQAKKKD